MATTTSPSTVYRRDAAASRSSFLQGLDWRRYIIYIGFVLVFLAFAATLGDNGFLTANNLLNIVRQSAIIAIIAVGMTYVIACAEIDLSVGSTAGLASVITAMAVSDYGLAGSASSPGCWWASSSGRSTARSSSMLNIPSFLVTLGMLGIAVGVAQWITDSAPAADPRPDLQPRLRRRQLRARARPARVDGDRRRHRRRRPGQDPLRSPGPGHRRQPDGRGLHRRSTPAGSSSRCW